MDELYRFLMDRYAEINKRIIEVAADNAHAEFNDPRFVKSDTDSKIRLAVEVHNTTGATDHDPQRVLRYLALPFSVHPDYRSEWAV